MASTTIPNTFVNGTVADANQVNGNFTELARAVNDEVVHRDGSTPMTAAFDAGNFKIVSLGTPTAGTDAATKAYVDSVTGIADGSVTTAKLAADAVDGTKIADDAINSEHYAAGSIDYEHFAMIPAVNYTGTTDTLSLTDGGCLLYYSNAALVTVTVPTNASVAFPTGTEMVLLSTGAGGLTLTVTSLTVLPSTAKLTVSQGEAIYLKKIATDTWAIIGGTAT